MNDALVDHVALLSSGDCKICDTASSKDAANIGNLSEAMGGGKDPVGVDDGATADMRGSSNQNPLHGTDVGELAKSGILAVCDSLIHIGQTGTAHISGCKW